MANTNLYKLIILFLLISSTKQVLSVAPECDIGSEDSCNDKHKALPLKIIAIVSILITSMIGVSLPLVTRSIPALSPEKSLFVIVKAFASGIILATGFMHVLPDSFDMLSSSCLKENPWHKFPFTGFVAMLSAIFTLVVDSMATSLYTKKNGSKSGVVLPEIEGNDNVQRDQERGVGNDDGGHFHGHHHHGSMVMKEMDGTTLLRYRVIAMVSIISFQVLVWFCYLIIYGKDKNSTNI